MKTLKFKTNIKCNGCIQTVTPHLNKLPDIQNWQVETESPDKVLTIEGNPEIKSQEVIDTLKNAGYIAEVL